MDKHKTQENEHSCSRCAKRHSISTPKIRPVPVLNRSKTSPCLTLKSKSQYDMSESIMMTEKQRKEALRIQKEKEGNVMSKNETFNDFAGLGGTTEDYVSSRKVQSPQLNITNCNDFTKQEITTTKPPPSRASSRHRIKLQTQIDSKLNLTSRRCSETNTATTRSSSCDRIKLSARMNANQGVKTKSKFSRKMSDDLLASSSLTSFNAARTRGLLAKATIDSSPISTPSLQRKRISIDDSPQLVSTPSSRQSSANSNNNKKDVQIVKHKTKDCVKELKLPVKYHNTGSDRHSSENVSKEKCSSRNSKTPELHNAIKLDIKTKLDKKKNSKPEIDPNGKQHSKQFDLIKEQFGYLKQYSSLDDLFNNDQKLQDNEDLTVDVFYKCLKWLQGLEEAQDEHSGRCLDVVTLPPIQWHEQ